LRIKGNIWFSGTLVNRCFALGQSLLCSDVKGQAELANAPSVQQGNMASIVCALLRTQSKSLGVIHLDRGPQQARFTQEDLFLADAIAAQVSVGVEAAQAMRKQRDTFIQTVAAMSQAVELRDLYTGGHTQRVTRFALLLADAFNLPITERRKIEIGTALHDIGKIGVPDAILHKPGRLTSQEFEQMKTHAAKGAMLQNIPDLEPILPMVRNHHERWDGQGYPDGLAGEQIPFPARIVALADAFDAMTSDRPYRRGMPVDKAFAELQDHAGKHFDPACVEAFLRMRPQVEAIVTQPARSPIPARPDPRWSQAGQREDEDAPRGKAPCAVGFSA
jgi:HD-GYP domain-containing protein (c-di-GMP phosphodiesterase class II)